MISFILNNQIIHTDKPNGISLLDFIRYEVGLSGTKIGCREGDCGACTVLEGTLTDDQVNYKSIVSCLTPIVNVHGKHIVTIEGINLEDKLSPVQKAIIDNAATQCGFCTPGFVMSFTGHCLKNELSTTEKAIAAVSGNICRCTGYKSIERAAVDIAKHMQNKDIDNPIKWMVEQSYLPNYFLQIPEKLKGIKPLEITQSTKTTIIGGGTDLMVQKADTIYESEVTPVLNHQKCKGISVENGRCRIGASTTVNELMQSPLLQELLPELNSQLALISSEPIRNVGTIAGNIVNASPIGDLSIILLALNSEITILDGDRKKGKPLKDLYLGYKKLNLQMGDLVESISFPILQKPYFFNFEKVSKRTYLDIASVNSAMLIKVDNNKIVECHLSAGGVSPIPLYLKETSKFLVGKSISDGTLNQANEVLQFEISPIGDIRGSIEYKRLLLKQLFFAHFLKLFPDKF
ncbi:xanthine dehydrogenase [Tenuifilaceae bacterium CYCD]|nr:xanthine dehydrogenase [Tenuifilaceae bacterium CYCD]